MTRTIGLMSHDSRTDVIESARHVADLLTAAGVDVVWIDDDEESAHRVELILVIGGDGTILRAAETAYATETPIMGINYGHVGFLAEADPSGLDDVVAAITAGEWSVEERLTVHVEVAHPDGTIEESWALNEASIEKNREARMIEIDMGIDSLPLSSFKCDAVLVSTPTGSTAYGFSAGAPVVWPNVEAMVVTPVAAHALFARPLVIGPDSRLSVSVRSDNALVWCDGRRTIEAPQGSLVEVRRGEHRVRLARLAHTPFSGRLVAKFNLPVEGWRRGGARD